MSGSNSRSRNHTSRSLNLSSAVSNDRSIDQSSNQARNQADSLSHSHNSSPAASNDPDSSNSSASTSPNVSPRTSLQLENESDDDEPEIMGSSAPLDSISAGIMSLVNSEASHADTPCGVWQMDRASLMLLAQKLQEIETERSARLREEARRKRSEFVHKTVKKILDMSKKLCVWLKQISIQILFILGMLCAICLAANMMWPGIGKEISSETQQLWDLLLSHFVLEAETARPHGGVTHRINAKTL